VTLLPIGGVASSVAQQLGALVIPSITALLTAGRLTLFFALNESMALTKRQKDVLDFIADFVEENGYSPGTGGNASAQGFVDRRLYQSSVGRDARHRADRDGFAVVIYTSASLAVTVFFWVFYRAQR
jgi:hypothetical protein